MSLINRLAHICIVTTDLEATAQFYGEVLGLEQGFTFVKEDRCIGYYFKLGQQSFLEVFVRDALPDGKSPIQHFCLEVADIDAVVSALDKAGCDYKDKKLGCDGSWQCWTTDPNGINIEFHMYTETSLQLTGGVCQVNW